MTASSVTGTGNGSSGKPGIKELGFLTSGPSIVYAGIVDVDEGISSPPSQQNTVTFPTPLEGGARNYAVIVTTVSAGYAYIAFRTENDDGDFTGFTIIPESEGIAMYVVVKIGQKANL